MRWATRVLLPAVAAGALLSACTTPGGPEVAVVRITSDGFQPASLEIAPGTEVRWVNDTTQAHTVTVGGPLPEGEQAVPSGAEEFDSGRLREGETFARRFEAEGDHFYWCEVHGEQEQLFGTVRVGEA